MTDRNAATRQLSAEWRQAGIREGDMLLLHSSTKRILRRMIKLGFEPDLETVLESFLDALGPGGTLLLPLFNFDFTTGTAFDIRHTPSHMGALTEAGRVRAGAVRTGHPIYSFAVLGSRKELFAGVNNLSGYGADSPFGMVHKEGGKIAVLDLPDQDSMTFYHYVEESMKVPYRFHKQFTGLYTDFEGNTSPRTYSLFVRKLDEGVVTRVEPMGELLWEKGLYAGDRAGVGSGLRVIDAQNMYDEVAGVIRAGKARDFLYETR
jgi:aminoglycoside 3-N-acetyltransferase